MTAASFKLTLMTVEMILVNFGAIWEGTLWDIIDLHTSTSFVYINDIHDLILLWQRN